MRVVSLIAIVPDSECSTPILIVPWVWAVAALAAPAITAAATTACQLFCSTLWCLPLDLPCRGPAGRLRHASKIKAKPRMASARVEIPQGKSGICLNHRQRRGASIVSARWEAEPVVAYNFLRCEAVRALGTILSQRRSPTHSEEEKMAETLQRRWIAKLHFRRSARREATSGELTTILVSHRGSRLFCLRLGKGGSRIPNLGQACSFCFNDAAFDAGRGIAITFWSLHVRVATGKPSAYPSPDQTPRGKR